MNKLLDHVAEQARGADVFDAVEQRDGAVVAAARGASAPAEYLVRVDEQAGTIWIVLRTADRWLSESIEAELMHTGDKLEELVEDELVELDCPAKVTFEHFRDDDLQYTFRSPIRLAVGEAADDAAVMTKTTAHLLAYEAAFRELGDMSADDES